MQNVIIISNKDVQYIKNNITKIQNDILLAKQSPNYYVNSLLDRIEESTSYIDHILSDETPATFCSTRGKKVNDL